MRETPLETQSRSVGLPSVLFRGEFDMMILLTGVGTRALDKTCRRVIHLRILRGASKNHCGRARAEADGRGCAKWEFRLRWPYPNQYDAASCWPLRQVDRITDAVQEYGKSKSEFNHGIACTRRRGDHRSHLSWDLPEDTTFA